LYRRVEKGEYGRLKICGSGFVKKWFELMPSEEGCFSGTWRGGGGDNGSVEEELA